MTRKEIIEKARDLSTEVLRPIDFIKGERMIESYSVALVRATLEEAARVVCYRCNCGNQPAHSEMFGWFHPDGGANPDCYAGSIHDLIAKLDAKGQP